MARLRWLLSVVPRRRLLHIRNVARSNRSAVGPSCVGPVERRHRDRSGSVSRGLRVVSAFDVRIDFGGRGGDGSFHFCRLLDVEGHSAMPAWTISALGTSIAILTNAIESLNARFRQAVRHRGHFPNEQAAMKILYLVATTRRKNREKMTGRING